jgi:hypothetical protein
MSRWRQFGIGALLLTAVVWAGTALAADSPEPTLHLIPDLHLSISEVPGEVSVRVPLAADGHVLYGLLSPYVSLGSSTTLGVPWATSLPPGLRRDTDGLEDVRLGAGMAVPLSERAQLYGEYRFLRGRLDAGVGRGLLQREPDSADFRAGFSIRID